MTKTDAPLARLTEEEKLALVEFGQTFRELLAQQETAADRQELGELVLRMLRGKYRPPEGEL